MNRGTLLVASLLCALPGGWLASLAWPLTTPARLVLVFLDALAGSAIAAVFLVQSPAGALRPGTATEEPTGPERGTAGPDALAGPDAPAVPEDTGVNGVGPERASLIAQCPRCGELRLDSGQHGLVYRFRCGNPACRHAWTWHPDEPWPSTVLRRNLPIGPDRPGRPETGEHV